jgi:hypothetical protein
MYFANQVLNPVNWDPKYVPDGLSGEVWVEWCDRFQQARLALLEVLQKQRKNWGDLVREAIHVDRNFEDIFGEPGSLRINIAKARQAEETARVELQACAQRIQEVLNPKMLWDSHLGHYYERTPEQVQQAFKVLRKEEDMRKRNSTSAFLHYRKALAKFHTFKRAQTGLPVYFKDLQKCWDRIQSRQNSDWPADVYGFGPGLQGLGSEVFRGKWGTFQACHAGISDPGGH